MNNRPIPKLKIFSDRSYLPKGMAPTPMLYPFWRDLHTPKIRSWVSPYNHYMDIGPELFTLTDSLENADIALLPMDWAGIRGDSWRSPIDRNAQHLAQEYARKVNDSGIPLLAFFSSDCSDEDIPIQLDRQENRFSSQSSTLSGKQGKLFRQSAYASRHRNDQRNGIMPFFCEDYINTYFQGNLPTRPHLGRPTLSFCGFARPLNLQRKLQTVAYKAYMLARQKRIVTSIYKGQSLRFSLLNTLQKDKEITPNFTIHNQSIFFDASNEIEKEKTRIHFLENIINSDYVFCCRGAANYSNRFYETLACGRIPVLIDTDCQLPFEEFIDWDHHCIRVPEQNTPEQTAHEITNRILAFHRSRSSQEFTELQQDCYKLWKKWLSPEGFYSNVLNYFSGAIHNDSMYSIINREIV